MDRLRSRCDFGCILTFAIGTPSILPNVLLIFAEIYVLWVRKRYFVRSRLQPGVVEVLAWYDERGDRYLAPEKALEATQRQLDRYR
ncbi:hypothetical protein CKA32_000793 [Geitlerinema sp. FC II]|nr:hypothetical protein CKA32_000793 [Geitlerinema sp. FC II]